MAQEGPYVEVEVDRARDEVGDLARTFALMQLRLQQQEEARRAFVATASHELRTPLTSLEGMLEMLDEDLAGCRHRSRRRAGAAGQRPRPVPAAGAARGRPARSQPARRTGGAAVRAGRALRAQPRGDRGVRAGDRRAQDRLRARRLVRARVGAGRSRQRRADPADPARQRRAGQPGRRRDQDPDAQRAGCVAQRLRPGSWGDARGARADLRALPARPRHHRAGGLRAGPGDRPRARRADGRRARTRPVVQPRSAIHVDAPGRARDRCRTRSRSAESPQARRPTAT